MDADRKKTFVWLTVLLYIIATLHIAALYFFWYWSVWWYDILVHTLGGVWIGGMALFILLGKGGEKRNSLFMRFFLPLVATALIGILWEAYEWNVDQIILFRFQGDMIDTLSDIGADISGGFIATLLWARQNRQEGRIETHRYT